MRIAGKGTPAFLITSASAIKVIVTGRIDIAGTEHLLVREMKVVGEFHKKTVEKGAS